MRHARIVVLGLSGALAAGLGTWRLSRPLPFQIAGRVVSRVETTDSVIALTLDDGPMEKFVEPVLQVLHDQDIRATFFLCGAEMERWPESVRRIRGAGHEIGNHSYSHRRMVWRKPWSVRSEIERTDSLIHEYGQAGPVLFRPPYGQRLIGLPLYLAATRRVTVMWDVAPDWEMEHDSASIVDRALREVRPGSVLLLHIMMPEREQSRRALPALIGALRAKGYRFVTVSALIDRQQAAP